MEHPAHPHAVGDYAVLVLVVARSMGLQTRSRPPVAQPEPALVGQVAHREVSLLTCARTGGRFGAAEAAVYSQPGFERSRSHGVWGNWQPDWFWSS